MRFDKPKNVNYCATVAKISAMADIPGFDRIGMATVLGSKVVVSRDMKLGGIGLYFPVECQLSTEFMAANNLYRHPELNADKTRKGFFEDNGRVRCMAFKGNRSEGFFIPMESLAHTTDKHADIPMGTEFDVIDGHEICRKYIGRECKGPSGVPGGKKERKLLKVSRLVPNQFRFHVDTAQLKRRMELITPDSIISVTRKLHGTSAVVANVLVKRKLSWKDRVAAFFGAKVERTEYGMVYSSRSVVKNDNMDSGGFYKTDVWKEVADALYPKLPKGYTIYGEIVGYLSGSQSMIQKGYHYGCPPGTNQFYAYRVTCTNADGEVLELSWPQIQEFCQQRDIKTVPHLYYGAASGIYRDTTGIFEDWRNYFLEYLERKVDWGMGNTPCPLNAYEVPSEGIVVRLETLSPVPLKLKNIAFLERETQQLDKGEADMEEDAAQEGVQDAG